MTPAARAAAAITILHQILQRDPAEAALLRWARSSRFAGSGDRMAVRDLVFDSLRRKRSRAALGGAMTGRGLILGMCREEGRDLSAIFSGEGHAPAPLSDAERAASRTPIPGPEALDLPDWLWPLWSQSLGPQAEPIAQAMRDRAPVWLRVNTLRASPDDAIAALEGQGIRVRPAADLPTALRVSEGVRRLAASDSYLQGLVELQDLSPQLACAALPQVGTALDFCAGGGGKALALAARGMQVTAHDANRERMSDLPARAERAGARIRVAAPGQVRGQFDLVVADVPCSGSGTWRRTPDAKWRFDAVDLDRLLALQSRILDQAAAHVGSGGYLAYMTCSLLGPENGDQAAAFAARAGFDEVSARVFTPLDASDGFFLSILQRR